MYLKTVGELGICPVGLVTDLGTENVIAASIQSFFQGNPDAPGTSHLPGIKGSKDGGRIFPEATLSGSQMSSQKEQ
eukprot:gene14588-16093_t